VNTVAPRSAHQRGRTKPLSEEEVVATALAIVAEAGVAGLTMRLLSERLGVALGATYKYVPNKHALLVLVANELFTQIEHDVPEQGEWSARVGALFVRVYDTFRGYPGLADQIAADPPSEEPLQFSIMLIKLLSDAGFSRAAINDLMSALFFYTTGALLTTAQPSAPSSPAAFGAGLDLLLRGARDLLEDTSAAQRG
jgi:AcrR family transcriptional regulator